ncbi:TetR/AcrR family transcriptional regulator [Leifsonia shinshuensis]|uniref:TetR/AcrR family transcriptional regulator n=1 Tax=Leifsonia shinshuensis TaxID=150026 RepID=UPI0016286139|nr:TetR/AcrR family transcriptional regulator [Leifsonia shinshuensis]
MPKIVDHDQRRRDIVDAYLRVLARTGVAGTHGRSVAADLGVVPGTLWHYFDSVEEIAEAAAQRGIERTLERIAARTGDARGLAALLAIADEILPTSAVTREEARVVVAFWGQVHPGSDPRSAFGRPREFTELTRSALVEAVADGELVAATPVEPLVRLLDSIYAGEQVIWAAESVEADLGQVRRTFATAVAPWLDAAGPDGTASPAAGMLRQWAR